MRIIKEGNLDILKETKKFECQKCGCVFEADKGEYECDYEPGWKAPYYYCVCPCCKDSYCYEIRSAK